MNWSDLAQRVIGLGAPLVGGALGGPAGAAAGRVLAQVFNVEPTPEAVGAAIEADGPMAATLAGQAEAEWARAQGLIGAAQVAAVGQTQRQEARSDDLVQRWWRPVYALELSLLECPAFIITLVHALWTGHEAGIDGFARLSGLLMAYFGARFGVLGVYVSGRTREKQAGATGWPVASLTADLAKALSARTGVRK